MDERIIRITAVIGEKDRQVTSALGEICNLKAEVAVRDARLSENQSLIAALKKQIDSLLTHVVTPQSSVVAEEAEEVC